MKHRLLIPLGAVAVALVWLTFDTERRETLAAAIGLTTRTPPAVNTKPICDYPVNPTVAAPIDCIPAHLANLPPDPGPEGKLTIDGIDSDKDGMRDDVQRWIATEWGHSEIATKALTMYAQMMQSQIHFSDSLGREETRKRFDGVTERTVSCFRELETVSMRQARAREELKVVVLNTPERYREYRKFDSMFAGTISTLADPKEACGFDVAALVAKSGEQTMAGVRAATNKDESK